MLRQLVLDALAKAARAGEDHIARRVLTNADPAVAWWLRRRVADRIRWATSCVADPSDRSHVLRLAFLREAQLVDHLDFEDRAAVRAAFDAVSRAVHGAPRPRTWTISLACVSALVLLTGVLVQVTRPETVFSPLETPLGSALGGDLTKYVSALYQLRAVRERGEAPPDSSSARDRLLAGVARDLGGGARGSVDDLLRSYQEAVLAGVPGGEALGSSLLRVNASLHAAQTPYFLDVIHDPGSGPILTSYYIAKERAAIAEGATIRVIRAQRLDAINRSLAVLGYTNSQLGAAIVTLDMLEREIVTVIAPALVEGGRAHLFDADAAENEAAWVEPLEARVGEIFRRDAASFRSPNIDRVLTLLARRDRLFRSFRRATARPGFVLEQPTTLVSRGDTAVLDARVPQSELREWEDINDELAQEPLRAAFDQLVERFAERIDRHEVQHQIDFRRGLLIVPEPLRALLGMPDTMDVAPYSNAARCRDELSADLAAVGAFEGFAATSLALASQPVFDRGNWGTPHAFGAAIILSALSEELATGHEGALFGGRRFDRQRAKSILLAVLAHPPDVIARAARNAYRRLFGYDAPIAEFGPWRTSRAWRR